MAGFSPIFSAIVWFFFVFFALVLHFVFVSFFFLLLVGLQPGAVVRLAFGIGMRCLPVHRTNRRHRRKVSESQTCGQIAAIHGVTLPWPLLKTLRPR
jgi:hypothetical protein